MTELKEFIKNAFNFNGRARRREYFVGTLLCEAILFTFAAIVVASYGINLFLGLVLTIPMVVGMMAFTVACITCIIRRLHDAGKSTLYILLQFIPAIGSIIMLFFLLQDSQDDNEWGPNPKADENNIYYGSVVPKAILSIAALFFSFVLYTAAIVFMVFSASTKYESKVNREESTYKHSSGDVYKYSREFDAIAEQHSFESEESAATYEYEQNIPEEELTIEQELDLDQTQDVKNDIKDRTFAVLIFGKDKVTPDEFAARYGNTYSEADVLNTIDTYERFTPDFLIDYCKVNYASMTDSDWIGVRLVIKEGIISEDDLVGVGVPEEYLHE